MPESVAVAVESGPEEELGVPRQTGSGVKQAGQNMGRRRPCHSPSSIGSGVVEATNEVVDT